jgi:hypothetical protein
MTLYSVTYSNPAALYLPKMNMLIECSKDEIWTLATALGLVQKIALGAVQFIPSIGRTII